MGSRYEEAASDAMYAFLQDATTGLEARLTAINTDMNDAYSVATKWSWMNSARRRKRGDQPFPVCAVVARPGKIKGNTHENSNVWEFPITVQASLSYLETLGVPQAEQTKAMRVLRAIRECTQESENWDGNTLGDRVLACRQIGTPEMVALLDERGRTVKRVLAVSVRYNVDLSIATAITA